MELRGIPGLRIELRGLGAGQAPGHPRCLVAEARSALWDSVLDIGGDHFEIVFRGLHRIFRLDFANDSEVIERYVSFAAHSVEEIEGWGKSGVEVLLRKLNDRDMMTKLHAGSLTMAQHQSQGRFEHGLISS